MTGALLEKTGLGDRVAVVCVGNELKGDDGFGPLLAKKLEGGTSLTVIDAGSSPENCLGVILREKPDTVLFADAADFGGSPGEARLIRFEDFSDSSFFLTHNAPLKLLRDFISASGEGADALLLCVQPKTLRFGDEPSPEVREQAEKIAGWFRSNYPPG